MKWLYASQLRLEPGLPASQMLPLAAGAFHGKLGAEQGSTPLDEHAGRRTALVPSCLRELTIDMCPAGSSRTERSATAGRHHEGFAEERVFSTSVNDSIPNVVPLLLLK